MPMDIAPLSPDARSFVGWAVATSLGLFGLLRLPSVEAQLVLPLTLIQGQLGVAIFGSPALPVAVTLACSGADALALCVGAVLAYPAAWPRRLAGAAGGIALILLLNTLRIGSLGLVAGSPWFAPLHVYGWPALLTLAIAGYVFGWMHVATRTRPAQLPDAHDATLPNDAWQPSRRFIALTATFVVLFAAASPFYLESPVVLKLGAGMALVAASLLQGAGVAAHASSNLLTTAHGTFVVTQECISTPLIPLYLAAVCAYSSNWRRIVVGALATLPLFMGLGIIRLLLVAVPGAAMATPMFLVHAFYQLLLGAVAVCVAAAWSHPGRAAIAYAAAGLTAAAVFTLLLGPAYAWLITPSMTYLLSDPQGAIASLPVFQVALYLALMVAARHAGQWLRFASGLALLAFTQVAGLLALHALTGAGFTAQVRDIRAWAVAAPVLIFATLVTRGRASR